MRAVPKDDRIALWTNMMACHSFVQARAICDALKAVMANIPDNMLFTTANMSMLPLSISLIVLYGRPFKQRKPLRLSEKLIPAQLRGTHDFLIMLRDKVTAHTDIDGPAYGDTLVNNTHFVISGGKIDLQSPTLLIRPKELNNVATLLDSLCKKTDYHARKLWDKHTRTVNIPDGSYLLNITDVPEAPLLLPLTADNETDLTAYIRA